MRVMTRSAITLTGNDRNASKSFTIEQVSPTELPHAILSGAMPRPTDRLSSAAAFCWTVSNSRSNLSWSLTDWSRSMALRLSDCDVIHYRITRPLGLSRCTRYAGFYGSLEDMAPESFYGHEVPIN